VGNPGPEIDIDGRATVNRAKQNFPLLLLRIESTDVVNTAFLSWVRKNRWLLASICDHVNTAEFLRRGPAARRGSTSDNLYSFSVGNSLSRYRSKRLKTGKYSACRLEQRLESQQRHTSSLGAVCCSCTMRNGNSGTIGIEGELKFVLSWIWLFCALSGKGVYCRGSWSLEKSVEKMGTSGRSASQHLRVEMGNHREHRELAKLPLRVD
jgi:hypothetical protein